jgi:hypothetical protein
LQDLKPIKKTQEYERFAIDIEAAVERGVILRIPKPPSSKPIWKLHFPTGSRDVKAKPGAFDDSTLMVSRDPDGNILKIIMTSGNTGECDVQFTKEDGKWDGLKWCMLSVETGDCLRLFSFQLPEQECNKWKFNNYNVFSLPFGNLSDWASAKTIRIESVDLNVKDFGSLHFERVNADGKQTITSSEIPQPAAERILLGKIRRVTLEEALPTSGPMELKFYPKPMNDYVQDQLREQVTQIAEKVQPILYTKTFNQIKPQSADDVAKNLTNDLYSGHTGGDSSYNKIRGALQARSVELQTIIDLTKEKDIREDYKKKKETVDEILNELDRTVKNLMASSDHFRTFRSSMQKAEIMSMSLHYDFKIPNPKDPSRELPVPVTLEFKSTRN